LAVFQSAPDDFSPGDRLPGYAIARYISFNPHPMISHRVTTKDAIGMTLHDVALAGET
jgi:hypothetical protein